MLEGRGVGGEKPCDGLASHPAENRYTPGHFILEGLNGVNRQPSKTEYFYRQPSHERAKISRQISQVSLNDRDRLPKWGHQFVEQAINTSSGNGGDVITLIIHIVVIVEDQ